MFPGEKGVFAGWSKSKARLDEDIVARLRKNAEEQGLDPGDVPPPERWTLHDLRRSLATGLQKLGVRLEVTEAVLNHISGSRKGIVGVATERHTWGDEKRAALTAWGAHVAHARRGTRGARERDADKGARRRQSSKLKAPQHEERPPARAYPRARSTKTRELRALMEQYNAAPPAESERILKAFIAKADARYPNWRETREAAESDGRTARSGDTLRAADTGALRPR